jgi:hypothetical protein
VWCHALTWHEEDGSSLSRCWTMRVVLPAGQASCQGQGVREASMRMAMEIAGRGDSL